MLHSADRTENEIWRETLICLCAQCAEKDEVYAINGLETIGSLDGCCCLSKYWPFEWVLADPWTVRESIILCCLMRCSKYFPMRCSKHCLMRAFQSTVQYAIQWTILRSIPRTTTGYSMMLFIMISDYDIPAQVKDWTTVFDSITYWSSHCAINRYLAYFNVSSIDCCKNTCHRCHLAKILIETASNRVI